MESLLSTKDYYDIRAIGRTVGYVAKALELILQKDGDDIEAGILRQELIAAYRELGYRLEEPDLMTKKSGA